MNKYTSSIVILLCSLSLSVLGQGIVYHYDYDASGNRIKRYIEVKPMPNDGPSARQGIAPSGAALADSTQNGTLPNVVGENQVYPNPTFGLVNVELAQPGQKAYQLVNPIGQVVLKGTFNSGSNAFDITAMERGNYILTIGEGTEVESWIIVKQ